MCFQSHCAVRSHGETARSRLKGCGSSLRIRSARLFRNGSHVEYPRHSRADDVVAEPPAGSVLLPVAARPSTVAGPHAGAMPYRPDIDGLRAVAVLAVIFYHITRLVFSGGFVGVDIFFVISGYLIGGIIIDETENGSFSYRRFYVRRIKRLFPAFFVVCLVTVPLAWWLLMPTDFRAQAKSLVAATVFLTNHFFYKETGYFDAARDSKPLLHTWSLSVEEQFYICFPLFMRFMTRLGRRAMPVALGIAGLASFAYAQYLLSVDPAASFYSLGSRGWELLLGAAVALPQLRHRQLPARWRRTLTWISLAPLLLPMVLYTDDTPFPGLAALPCCLGTAWLLWAGRAGADTLPQQALSGAIPVTIGRMSYSLYLWHWPIFVYMNYYAAGELGWIGRAVALVLTFVLGALSWHFIEQPLRATRRPPSIVFGTALAGSALLAIIGFGIYRSDGVPGRLTAQTRAIAFADDDFQQIQDRCYGPDNSTLPGVYFCRIGATNAPEQFLVWGDSHARAMRDGLDQIAAETGVGGLLIFSGGCLPAFDTRKEESATGPRSDRECSIETAAVKRMLAQHSSIRKVLLIGRWSYYTEGRGIGIDSQNVIRVESTINTPHAPLRGQAEVVKQALSDTVRWLHARGFRVYLLQQIPEIPEYSSRKLFQVVRSGKASVGEAIARFGRVPLDEVERRQRNAGEALEAAAASGATILSTHQLFCDEHTCSAWDDSGPAYFDNNHVTGSTARRIRRIFLPAIVAAGATTGASLQ
jgi:peptidoglycan/LPS O-acetylase OafA/YrhL